MAAVKRSATRKPRAIKATSLAVATNAAVKAALKRAQLPGGGGTTVGIIFEQASAEARGVDADALAKQITTEVSAATGVKLKATSKIAGGAILVGFAPPDTLLKPVA